VGEPREHQRILLSAIEREGTAYRQLLNGEVDAAREGLTEAARLYRSSWEVAPPRSFGRLAGYLKTSILADRAEEAAAFVRAEIGPSGVSPASWYALGLAALVEGDDEAALRSAQGIREGLERLADPRPFSRAADAIVALATSNQSAFRGVIVAMVADFEARSEHLTGVAIADTALVLERLAARQGFGSGIDSELLPRV
jgi:hypothetical protein